jgi:cytochrome P450
VYRTPFDFWYVTRYDLANAIMRGDAAWSVAASSASSSGHDHDGFAFQVMARMLLTMDGVDHSRLRRLVSTIFTGRAAERLRDKVQASVERQLDGVAGRTEVDLFSDVAQLLPTEVILDVLGIGHEHAPAAVAVADSLIAMHEPTAGEATLAEADRAFRAAADLVVALAADRRTSPRDDLLTALVQAADGSDRLSDDELVAMVIILVVAGHETTANTLCTGMLHLLQDEGALAALRADPTLVPSAVEELLRYDAATRNSVARYAVDDIEVGGATIRKGDKLFVSLHAANHDPAEFADPLALDLTRTPNRHIGFGGGAHYCLGAAVARMELQVALAALLERYSGIELAGEPVWRRSFIIRGLESLPLRLDAT